MQFHFRRSLKIDREKLSFIKLGEEQRVLYKRPMYIYNHNPLNYLNNEEYIGESSEENQNTYFIYPTKFSKCLKTLRTGDADLRF